MVFFPSAVQIFLPAPVRRTWQVYCSVAITLGVNLRKTPEKNHPGGDFSVNHFRGDNSGLDGGTQQQALGCAAVSNALAWPA
jgi:hypothetical protein